MTRKQAGPTRKLYGIRMDQAIMLEIQHLALDQDRYVNELLEEAARDLLKKYADKEKAPDPKGKR